jgi:hypothetical protein
MNAMAAYSDYVLNELNLNVKVPICPHLLSRYHIQS